MLSPEHEHSLVSESGIAADVIAGRGYQTITVRAELRRLGFSDIQARVPALLIPVWSARGEVALYQARPDQPRIRNGKAVKYETPAGSHMVIDTHPSVVRYLPDPRTPLYITEGIKKGDALVSRGACALALLGVWNWRGTNEFGGKAALAEWEDIALNDRTVYAVFDSDVMTKPEVHAALARLKGFLESRGAKVQLIYLPAGDKEGKIGVDDYLAGGRSLEDLAALATPILRKIPSEGPDGSSQYEARPSGIVWNKATKDGQVSIPLSNFTARIVADILEDDGAEQRRLFEIEATLSGRKKVFTTPATQFPALNWATEHLGAGAVVYPGFGLRDHARAAIQILSPAAAERRVSTHTGWRRLDGEWAYLHAGGAIGSQGLREDAEVNLQGPLARLVLPEPPTGNELILALRVSLDLLELGPLSVTAPILAAVYLAPLREALSENPPDLTLWLHGPSGAFKSELAALAQGHYGPFTRTTLPTTFSATANAIERLLFTAKDALVVVDDYHPAHDRYEAQAIASVASRLLRGVGNNSGRARMRADTTFRPALPPRCLVLATGERIPDGHSTVARMFPVPVAPGVIDQAKLTEAQENARLLPHAMSAYLRWMAGKLDSMSSTIPERFRELRASAVATGSHAREPAQIAHLYLGLETWLSFAGDVGAVSPDEATALLSRAWDAIISLTFEHGESAASETPTSRFLALLSDAFSSRQAYLEHLNGGPPADGENWGWEERFWHDREGDERRELHHSSSADLLGKIEGEWLLLYPETTYEFVATAARNAGQVFPVELKTLLKRLDEEGLIGTEPGSGRRTVNVRFGPRTQRVIKLRRDALSIASTSVSPSPKDREQGEHRQQNEDRGSLVPLDSSPKKVDSSISGNNDGQHADVGATAVSVVPSVPPSGDRESPMNVEWEIEIQ